jgi:hypothetical protein
MMNRRAGLFVISGGAFVLAALAATVGVVALTSEIVPATLLVCESPADARCTDDFFFGRQGGQHTVGSAFMTAAVLLSFLSGAVAVLAARKPVENAAPPAHV